MSQPVTETRRGPNVRLARVAVGGYVVLDLMIALLGSGNKSGPLRTAGWVLFLVTVLCQIAWYHFCIVRPARKQPRE